MVQEGDLPENALVQVERWAKSLVEARTSLEGARYPGSKFTVLEPVDSRDEENPRFPQPPAWPAGAHPAGSGRDTARRFFRPGPFRVHSSGCA